MNAEVVGKRIKTLRFVMCLNQKMFSEKIGVNQSTLSAYENGNALPSVDVLIAIAKTFNVSLDWLCDISNNDFSISSVGVFGKMLFALDDSENVRFELEINDKLGNDIETEEDRWYAAIKFYGNDREHPENASICQMLSSFANYRREFETYFINKEFFDMGKDKIVETYSRTPLTKRAYEEISERKRIQLRDELITKEMERKKSQS